MADDASKTPALDPADLLGLKDAQRELGVGRSLMYQMIADGEIAAITHVGRKWIERSEIDAYWQRRRDDAARERMARARDAARRRSTTTPADRKNGAAAPPVRPSAA